MALLTEAVVIGIIFIVINFNFKHKGVQLIASGVSGAVVILFCYEEGIRLALGLFFILIVIITVLMILKELYSTMMTFMLTAALAGVIIIFLMMSYPEYEVMILYVGFTLFIIIYSFIGVWLNRLVIQKMFGMKKVAEQFTGTDLRANMNIIYVLIFIAFNTTGVIYARDDIGLFYTILNNCFITAIALNQIMFK